MNTREKQVELVKKLLKTGVSDDARMVLEKQFPEVAEGRNERIRKNCVHFLELQKAHHADTSEIDDCIAYLEKQRPITTGMPFNPDDYEVVQNGNATGLRRKPKEQKPVECDKETDIQKAFREGQNAGRQEVFDNPETYGLEKIDNVFGFRIGDKVRLVDGDGRPHIIKYFERIEGLHSPDFYRVVFEDNTALGYIIPGDEYPNSYFTCIKKIDAPKEQKSSWVDVNCSIEKIVFPFIARVKSSGKIVTIKDGQLSMDAKQWTTFQSNISDGYKVYKPDELLIEQKATRAITQENFNY